jgi:hypothetical protein
LYRLSQLTDFSSFIFPQISVATPAEMFAISPLDIVTKLRFFLAVILILFGVMHAGAALGYVLDARGRAEQRAALTSPRFGFEELPGGVWTWALYQRPVTGAFGAVSGPVVELAAVIGVPYARLRCAIPEELLAGDMAHMVGRSAGLSVSASEASKDAHNALMKELHGGGGGGGGGALGSGGGCCAPRSRVRAQTTAPLGGKPDAEAEAAVEAGSEPGSPARSVLSVSEAPPWEAPCGDEEAARGAGDAAAAEAARATSTALIFALMWVRLLAPREELASRQAAAAAHFNTVRTVAGNFDDLVARFKDLLSGGNLHTRSDWLEKARLWRLILLQDPAGFWDASGGLAFALHATAAAPGGARGRPVAWQAPLRALRALQLRGDAWDHSDDEGGVEGGSPLTPRTPTTPSSPSTPTTPATPSAAVRDDPLHFSLDGVTASLPRALRHAAGAPPLRLWATLLCIAMADAAENGWVVNGDASKEGEEEEVTLVDLAEGWLADVASRDPVVAAALPRARAKAARMTREWALVQEERVAALRSYELRQNDYHVASQLQRIGGDVAKALQTKHETFATFLAPPVGGLTRWQQWMLMLTAIIGGLTVEIWFFQRKSATCCRELRELLGCAEGALGSPCRGFGGDCADLQAQFLELPPEVLPPGADVAGYECHAFPDDDNPIDQFWVGLIFAASAVPLRYIITILMESANEAEHSEAWMRMPRRDALVARCLGFKPFSWRYADVAKRPAWVLRFWARWPIEPFNAALDLWVDLVTVALVWSARACGCACGCGPRGATDGVALPAAEDKAEAEAEEAGGAAEKAGGDGDAGAAADAAAAPAEDGASPENGGGAAAAAVGADAAAADAPAAAAAAAPAPPSSSSLPRPAARASAVALQGSTLRMRRPSALSRLRRTSSTLRTSVEVLRRRSTQHLGGKSGGNDGNDGNEDSGIVESADEILAAMEAEFENAVKARVMAVSGLIGIYLSWGILTWFIFAYGLLIYTQLGAGAEESFVRAWLVALGVDNAAQWKDVAVEALKGAALMLLLDRLWLVSNARWVEARCAHVHLRASACIRALMFFFLQRLQDHVDVLSVTATMLTGGAVSRWQRLRAHLRFFAYVEDG